MILGKEEVIILIVSYLIGSISPGFFLGKIIKNKDIRKLPPAYNTGATNVYHNVSPSCGVITAIIDIFKGFVIMSYAYNYPIRQEFVLLAGFVAFLGHVFPFYLGFRGGTGVSTLAGTTLFSILLLDRILAMPKLLIFLAYSLTVSPNFRHKLHRFKIVRKIYRLLAISIPIVYLYFGKNALLKLLIPITTLALIVDILRLKVPKINSIVFSHLKFFLKEKERSSISTTSLFLLSCLIVTELFTREIALLSITLTIFGDMFAEIIGTLYGKHKIYRYKSLEGTLACFVSCLLSGIMLSKYISLHMSWILIASLVATIVELLSVDVDDNFTMPIITAIILSLL